MYRRRPQRVSPQQPYCNQPVIFGQWLLQLAREGEAPTPSEFEFPPGTPEGVTWGPKPGTQHHGQQHAAATVVAGAASSSSSSSSFGRNRHQRRRGLASAQDAAGAAGAAGAAAAVTTPSTWEDLLRAPPLLLRLADAKERYGSRHSIVEKNWMPFVVNDRLYITHSLAPQHRCVCAWGSWGQDDFKRVEGT
jgi:hypothetical protein